MHKVPKQGVLIYGNTTESNGTECPCIRANYIQVATNL